MSYLSTDLQRIDDRVGAEPLLGSQRVGYEQLRRTGAGDYGRVRPAGGRELGHDLQLVAGPLIYLRLQRGDRSTAIAGDEVDPNHEQSLGVPHRNDLAAAKTVQFLHVDERGALPSLQPSRCRQTGHHQVLPTTLLKAGERPAGP